MSNRLKLITAGILALLVAIVILQNTDLVETRILFITLVMPRAALLLLTTVIGFVLGVLFSLRLLRSEK
ncbi:MAG: hypothetical protein P8Y95_00565 [Gammaproteobacteria bacterium]|jgi:uncharacterized integral membrane protein